jgi:hypothetical protein
MTTKEQEIEKAIQSLRGIGKAKELTLLSLHLDEVGFQRGKAQALADEIEFLNKILGYNVTFLEMVELTRERLTKLQEQKE